MGNLNCQRVPDWRGVQAIPEPATHRPTVLGQPKDEISTMLGMQRIQFEDVGTSAQFRATSFILASL
jgi:hypothetical protein